jgi:hypothetical protein
MSGTTATGLPYPTGTDLVVDGDDAIRALAEKVTLQLPGAIQSRSVVVTMGGTQSRINYPVPYVTAVASVLAVSGSLPGTSVVVLFDGTDKTGFAFQIVTGSTPITTGTVRVNYFAVGL